MKTIDQFRLLGLVILLSIAACTSSSDKNPNPKMTLADTLSTDTSFCYRCLRANKTKTDSLACVQFCKGSGTGTDVLNGINYGYFELTIAGKTYHFTGMGVDDAPKDAEGFVQKGVLAMGNGSLGISGSEQKNNTIFKISFSFNVAGVNGPGTYTFNAYTFTPAISNVMGNLNPLGLAECNIFTNCKSFEIMLNQSRQKDIDDDCISTDLPIATQTLIITKWGNPGTIVEGTISGTVYENMQSGMACKSTEIIPYTGTFKIRRII